MIHGEGIDSLSVKELQHACQSRGIRFSGVSPGRLREELEQWIDFHYTNHVSGVLLVLSRAFHFDQKGDSVFKSLEATLSSLPDNLVRLRRDYRRCLSPAADCGDLHSHSSTRPSWTSRATPRRTSKSSRCCSSSRS